MRRAPGLAVAGLLVVLDSGFYLLYAATGSRLFLAASLVGLAVFAFALGARPWRRREDAAPKHRHR